MSDETKEYVRFRLARAGQALEAARASLERSLLNDAVNRLYYACFYAVSALLISRGLSSSKHSGVRSLFERHFVKDGPLPKPLGRFYHQLSDSRQEGDYTDFATFAREDVASWSAQAEEFVAAITSQLEKQSGEGMKEKDMP